MACQKLLVYPHPHQEIDQEKANNTGTDWILIEELNTLNLATLNQLHG
jgi:hypothetical protein